MTSNPIELTMPSVLKAARAAYSEGRLQMQKERSILKDPPAYSGPCAIGAAVTSEQARIMDVPDPNSIAPYCIRELVEKGIVTLPAEQLEDAELLQDAHDSAWHDNDELYEVAVATFEHTLSDLEDKYGISSRQ